MLPDTLSRENRARWEAGKDTWHTFAGIPCQVGGGKRHLTRFCRDSVPGGRREETPGTLLQRNRARWEAGRCHLPRFRGDSVAGGRQERLPGTLSREYRGRWAAGRDTWNAFAGIPCQVGSKRCYLTRFCGDTLLLCQMENFIGI